jgi:hypothetical protein
MSDRRSVNNDIMKLLSQRFWKINSSLAGSIWYLGDHDIKPVYFAHVPKSNKLMECWWHLQLA